MRPIAELQQDAEKAASEGDGVLRINPAELHMLKEYGMVEGTADKLTALSTPSFGVPITFAIVEVLP